MTSLVFVKLFAVKYRDPGLGEKLLFQADESSSEKKKENIEKTDKYYKTNTKSEPNNSPFQCSQCSMLKVWIIQKNMNF